MRLQNKYCGFFMVIIYEHDMELPLFANFEWTSVFYLAIRISSNIVIICLIGLGRDVLGVEAQQKKTEVCCGLCAVRERA